MANSRGVYAGGLLLRGERGGDGRGKGWEEGRKKGEGKGKGGRKGREGEGGTCSKVLGRIDTPGQLAHKIGDC